MVSEKIKSCEVALGTLMHTVSDKDAAVLRRVRENLRGAAELAQEMEAALVPETAAPRERLEVGL